MLQEEIGMKWVSTFSYLPINYGVTLAQAADQSQRILFDNNLNGSRVRLRLTNRYGTEPLCLSRVTIGTTEGETVNAPQAVTLNGGREICLAPGQEVWSDEVELAVRAGERLAVTTYVDAPQRIEGVCAFWSTTGPMVRLSRSGDYTGGGAFEEVPARAVYPVIEEDANPVKAFFFYGVSGVQVLTEDTVKTVVMFGDSITHMSYVYNALNQRLMAAYPGQVSVLNRGIGGNRVLHDATKVAELPGEGCLFGRAGVSRFEEDVFAQEHADVVLVLEGINDIMHPIQFNHPEEQVTPEELVEGYRRYIDIAHRHGAKIFGATITACGHRDYPADWLPKFEAIRQPVNERLRNGIGYDGCFDYDAAVRDEARPGYLLDECHIHDGLHPNDEGGARMAAQIDLSALMV